ncbi:hypothetical protein KM043_004991 [Ampulex compressa]|nr:hypothetical protein KM043_004991 [Ampulex compressa]
MEDRSVPGFRQRSQAPASFLAILVVRLGSAAEFSFSSRVSMLAVAKRLEENPVKNRKALEEPLKISQFHRSQRARPPTFRKLRGVLPLISASSFDRSRGGRRHSSGSRKIQRRVSRWERSPKPARASPAGVAKSPLELDGGKARDVPEVRRGVEPVTSSLAPLGSSARLQGASRRGRRCHLGGASVRILLQRYNRQREISRWYEAMVSGELTAASARRSKTQEWRSGTTPRHRKLSENKKHSRGSTRISQIGVKAPIA